MGMSKAYEVSQSKVKTYRRCRRAYWYRYVDRLRKRVKSRPLEFGSIVHEMLDAFKEGDDPFAVLDATAKRNHNMFRAEREMYGDIIEDIRCIMEEYFDHYKDDGLSYVRIKGKSAEHEFRVNIDKDIILTGKIDAFARTPNKLRWLEEHKTFSKFPDEDARWRNLQSASYIRVVDILGLPPVDGVLWDYIHSKAPTKPPLLKNGTMTRKSMNTLPTRVLAAIDEYGLKRKDYRAQFDKAFENRRRYFVRVFNPVKERVVTAIFDDLITTAREMMDNHGKCKERNIDLHCSFCDYESICRAELQGSDVDFVKEREYEVSHKQKRKPEDYILE
jgi:CRISPR/Cas system-associated exonuclease Cas4 (RecB family)